ncbi:acyl-CoA dehydrogenase [Acrocarpospora pleiomorpha]|uniref:Acyl-CoA dehydrogenase n=1 Tax=Acrocarpospora pleiomorpha TaxID=90975 RepID=A0A5M3Y0V2_9ACTN|nr:acyl-CoA dehydrogenase family protein [Acrocarpospora pleiomorpha]GES25789.1 acyl-CoA dehydrogenase [Acrocarpospora pleiomorpha]
MTSHVTERDPGPIDGLSLEELRTWLTEWLRERLPQGWEEAIASSDSGELKVLREQLDEPAWWTAMAEAGLVAPSWPREYGGLGLGPEHVGVIANTLRRFKTPRARNPIGLNMVAPALLRWGSEQQRRELLPRIADQTQIWCQLFSEPGAGSDLASLSTRAVRDGDSWVVHGQKVWTSLGHVATRGILLARTDPDVPKHDGISVFLVDMTAPGVEIRPLRQITGDAEFNEVFLDGVVVSDFDRLGALGEGWGITRTILTHERSSDSGAGVQPGVIAGRSVEEVLRRAARATDRDLRARAVQAWIAGESLRLTIERSREARRAGRGGGVTGAVDGTVTKLMSTAHSQALQALAVDLEDLAGIAWEPDDDWHAKTAWSYLRVQAKTIAGGTLDITKSLCGERVLGLPREPSAESCRPWRDVRRSRQPAADDPSDRSR